MTARSGYGRQKIVEWRIPVAQCFYHKDGTWFNRLSKFPGALADPEGYVVFESERAYLSSSYLRVGEQTNVPGGIKTIPSYVRMA